LIPAVSNGLQGRMTSDGFQWDGFQRHGFQWLCEMASNGLWCGYFDGGGRCPMVPGWLPMPYNGYQLLPRWLPTVSSVDSSMHSNGFEDGLQWLSHGFQYGFQDGFQYGF
jgi:hypothetical protein